MCMHWRIKRAHVCIVCQLRHMDLSGLMHRLTFPNPNYAYILQVHLLLACTVRCHSLFVYMQVKADKSLICMLICWACIISSSLTIYNYLWLFIFLFQCSYRLAPILFANIFVCKRFHLYGKKFYKSCLIYINTKKF